MSVSTNEQKPKHEQQRVLRAGWHVAKQDLYQNLLNIQRSGGLAAQVYLSNRNSFAPGTPISDSEAAQIAALRRETGFYLVVHGKLLLNLCHTDETGPGVMPGLMCDLEAADRIGADVVVHQGKNVPRLGLSREEALTRFVLNLQTAIDLTPACSNRILLENSCQQGTELGWNIADLAMIWRMLEPEYRKRVGFCLDTCHAHVGGMMDLSKVQSIEECFEEFDQKIGLDHLRVIHFNDSEIRFDGHNDSHADLLVGHCGNPDLGGTTAGLRRVVELAQKHNIPCILETPGKVSIVAQLKLMLGWAGMVPDIEEEYVVQFQEHMSSFAANPGSRKGRKKKVTPAATAAAGPPAAAATAATTAVTLPTEAKIRPRITPKLPLPPLRNLAAKTSLAGAAGAVSPVTVTRPVLLCPPIIKKQ